MTAANAHAVLTGGAQQIAASGPSALAWSVVILAALAALGAAYGVGYRIWRSRRMRFPKDEIDVPTWVREPTQPSPVVTHRDAMRQRWNRSEDDSVFFGDGVTEAIRKINEEDDRA